MAGIFYQDLNQPFYKRFLTTKTALECEWIVIPIRFSSLPDTHYQQYLYLMFNKYCL